MSPQTSFLGTCSGLSHIFALCGNSASEHTKVHMSNTKNITLRYMLLHMFQDCIGTLLYASGTFVEINYVFY